MPSCKLESAVFSKITIVFCNSATHVQHIKKKKFFWDLLGYFFFGCIYGSIKVLLG